MKRLMCLLIVFSLWNGSAFSQKRELGKVKTVVIDAGHGGNKPGALGKKSKEKDITLAVALKLGDFIKTYFKDVTVIHTRESDRDIDLAQRAQMANKAKADLFISIHANSHKKHEPTGTETFVMGLSTSKANLEVAKTENADILLEEDYKNNSEYQGFDPNSPESYIMFAMYQNAFLDKSLNFAGYLQNHYSNQIKNTNRGVKQAELFVLYKTSMPAVLTEVGFISNPIEEEYMISEEGQNEIAYCIASAFAQYKANEEGSSKIEIPAPKKQKKIITPKTTDQTSQKTVEKQQQSVNKSEQAKKSGVNQNELSITVTIIDTTNRKTTDTLSQGLNQPIAQKTGASIEGTSNEGEKNIIPDSQVEYRVQFLVVKELLPENDQKLKGITGFDTYVQEGTIRYTLGHENNIETAKQIASELKSKGFKDAFIVPFINGKRITGYEAKKIIDKKK